MHTPQTLPPYIGYERFTPEPGFPLPPFAMFTNIYNNGWEEIRVAPNAEQIANCGWSRPLTKEVEQMTDSEVRFAIAIRQGFQPIYFLEHGDEDHSVAWENSCRYGFTLQHCECQAHKWSTESNHQWVDSSETTERRAPWYLHSLAHCDELESKLMPSQQFDYCEEIKHLIGHPITDWRMLKAPANVRARAWLFVVKACEKEAK